MIDIRHVIWRNFLFYFIDILFSLYLYIYIYIYKTNVTKYKI